MIRRGSEAHSANFVVIHTPPFRRFYLALKFLGLRRNGSSSQFIDTPQDFSKQVPGHGDFGQLERDVATVAHDLGPDLDQHLWQRGQRPVFHFFRQSESQDLILWTAPATGVAMCPIRTALEERRESAVDPTRSFRQARLRQPLSRQTLGL